MNKELTLYRELLSGIKVRVRQAQHKAALCVNAEMILMYWDIGHMIAARQEREGWGAGVIPRLAVDLKNELPEEKGFSERNIKRMLRFFREYPNLQQTGATSMLRPAAQIESGSHVVSAIVPQPAAQLDFSASQVMPPALAFGIPWFHHVILIEKVKDLPTRFWYARQVMEQGWSRDTLSVQVKKRAHERQGGAVTNFASTLPEVHAGLAQGLLKDPFLFDFLTLDQAFRERELETGLLSHIQKFLLELGRGFAFVGRQVRLEVSDREFYVDLLFYHLHLRCFVVVDLKKGGFKPEYAGKMNFYCSIVDEQLRHSQDAPTVGLILCQSKDSIVAEYALRDIHKPIGITAYELTRALPSEFASSLPSIETIEAELAREMDNQEQS